MRKFYSLIFLFFLIPSAFGEPRPESLLLLANQGEPRSVQFAQFYAEKRGVPMENIIVLPMPLKEQISWSEFSSQIYNPLLNKLLESGWINAVSNVELDAMGRQKYYVLSHKISTLLVCKGVPLKIKNSPELIVDGDLETWRRSGGLARKVPLDEKSLKYFYTNQSSVDSELALLVSNDSPTVAFASNPVFAKREPSYMDLQKMLYVSRMDAPRWESLESMVNDAIFVEKYGLSGRAYVDSGGPFHLGDAWLEKVISKLAESGLDYDVDRSRSTFSKYSRFDAPALYFGWYKTHVEGPFTVDGFRFPQGAIAVHLHSFSGSTLKSSSKNWLGPFLDKGAAATLGNVYEPTLFFCHHFDIFYEALLEGKSFVEAVYCSLPALSWQGVAVGDPLYRPFACRATSVEASVLYRPYTILAKAKAFIGKGDNEAAYEIVKAAWEKRPDLAYALCLAELHLEFSHKDLALDLLRYFQYAPVRPDEYGVLVEMASMASSLSAYDISFTLYARIMKDPRVDVAFRKSLMQTILPVAMKSKNEMWISVWEKSFEAK